MSVFVLPTELLVIIAKFASDEDLYSLTCVSRRMADVTCSILIARQGLTVDRVSVCVEGNAFNALPVWYRSVEFVPKSLLFCTFSDDHKQAASQITRLRTFLSLRPTGARFETVHLIGLDIKLPIDLLSLLDLIDLVGCQKVVMSARCVSWQQDIICSLGSTSASRLKDDDQSQLAGSPVCLSALKHLEIDYRFFSAALWAVFLERLHITSLSSLRICGESSISTLKQFLVRHPHISCIEVQPRSSIFHRRTPPSRALRGNLKFAKLSDFMAQYLTYYPFCGHYRILRRLFASSSSRLKMYPITFSCIKPSNASRCAKVPFASLSTTGSMGTISPSQS